jgi:MoxR-like ATPase
MPSDVTGFSIFNQKTREFEFRPGGIMSNIVLADEINRASAKTQSSLLEAMEERQVTVDSHTHQMEEPFMVLATQNPVEQYGTYPLPEAQVDRFLVKMSVGYPPFDNECDMLKYGKKAKAAIRPVVNGTDIVAARQAASQIIVSDLMYRYIVEIVTATRNSPDLSLGASPRGSIALASLARAYALRRGRTFVIPDDVKYIAPFVLGHRITLSHEAKIAGRKPRDIVNSIIAGIAVPVQDSVEGMENFLEETEASSKLTASSKKSFAPVTNMAKPAKKSAVQQQATSASMVKNPASKTKKETPLQSVASGPSVTPQVVASSQGKSSASYAAAPAAMKPKAATPQHEYAVVASSDDATRYAATSARDLVAVPVVMGADGSYHRVEDKASFSVPGTAHTRKDASSGESSSWNSVAPTSTVPAPEPDQGHSVDSSVVAPAPGHVTPKAQQIDNGQPSVPLDGTSKDQPIRVSLGDAQKDQPIRISL